MSDWICCTESEAERVCGACGEWLGNPHGFGPENGVHGECVMCGHPGGIDPPNGPRRVQISRTVPWRANHPNAVIVDHRTKFGNPWIPRSQRRADLRALVVDKYKRALAAGELPFTEDDVRKELAGKDLACWCPLDAECHADVLLAIANPKE